MAIDPQRVVVIGLGGIGSWFTDGAARMLHAQAPGSVMVLIDGDTFEEKNTERQNFKTFGNKAQAVRTDLRKTVPNIMITAMAAWVVDADHAYDDEEEEGIGKITPQSFMEEGDIVLCVVDNYACRKLVFDAAAEYENIDVFSGGNGSPEDGDALFGSTYHYQRRNSQDITSHPAVYKDEYANPADRNTGELSCQERAELDGGTQLVAVNMGVASFLLARLSLLLFGTNEEKEEMQSAAEIFFDLGKGGAKASPRVPQKSTVSV